MKSSMPAIYGIVAAAEVERLKPLTAEASQSDVQSLELTAAEMAQAAAELVATEREIMNLRSRKAEAREISTKENARAEAAAALERKMSAMEALLAARRNILAEPAEPQPPSASQLLEQMKPPQRIGSGAGAGNGFEILLQAFNWESHKHNYYKTLQGQVKEFAKAGISSVWLPPPSDSVSPQVSIRYASCCLGYNVHGDVHVKHICHIG